MKKLINLSFGLLAITALIFTSCSKLKEKAKVNFNLNSGTIEFAIPTITATGDATLSSKDVYLNVDSIIKANNAQLGAKYIKSVVLNSCTIQMLDGDAQNNFSALQSCKIEFSSNTNTNMITLAEITNNPDVEAYELTFPINSAVNLKDYFNATNFSYVVKGNARKTTNKDINCKAVIKYTVEAGL